MNAKRTTASLLIALCTTGATNAGIINGDMSTANIAVSKIEYGDIGTGKYGTNNLDTDGAGADEGWSMDGSVLSKSGANSGDRLGAAWFIDDLTGTGWSFEYDYTGTPTDADRILLFFGKDDGDNVAGDDVLGFGNDQGAKGGIVTGGAWVQVTIQPLGTGTDLSTPLGALDLGDYDILALKIIKTASGGDFDNFELVPEPGSLALLSLGGLLVTRRRR